MTLPELSWEGGEKKHHCPLTTHAMSPSLWKGNTVLFYHFSQDDSAFSSIDTQRNITYAVSLSRLSVCLLGFFSNKLFR